MNNFEMKFEQGGLTILVSKFSKTAAVAWIGVSDSRNPSAFLNPIAQQLVDKLKGCDVTLDFTKMEFMNSSTVSSIISLVKKLNASQINVLVLFNDHDWQKTHLRCMQTITRVLQYVRVEGRPAAAADR